jgi:hypothetical protein
LPRTHAAAATASVTTLILRDTLCVVGIDDPF